MAKKDKKESLEECPATKPCCHCNGTGIVMVGSFKVPCPKCADNKKKIEME